MKKKAPKVPKKRNIHAAILIERQLAGSGWHSNRRTRAVQIDRLRKHKGQPLC